MKKALLIPGFWFRNFGFVLIIFSTLLFTSCGKEDKKTGTSENQKTEEKKETPEGTSSGDLKPSDDFVITFSLQGAMNGEMTMYRSGKKLKQEISSDVMGMKNKTEVYIIDNFVFTVTDINGKKMGIKTDIQDYNKKKQTAETITDPKEFENYLADKKITGSENILGMNCDIYDMGNNTSLSIHDKRYVLKIKSPQFVATATRFEGKPSFSGKEFEIPADVNFRSINTEGSSMEKLDSIMKDVKKYKK
ncbi:MAG: hypothetical protein JSS91_11455 [Bacteroidetes bacterium]|nr:hypothetical protein [Bacteroidota bacterium]